MVSAFKRRRSFVKGALVLATAVGIAACEPIAFGGGGPSINTSAPVPVALLVPCCRAGDDFCDCDSRLELLGLRDGEIDGGAIVVFSAKGR